MHITELKSQNVKILYKPGEYRLKVGDFISFKDGELTLIAQIFKITSSLAARNGQALVLNYVKKYFLPEGVENFKTTISGNVLLVTAVAIKN